MFVLLVRFVEHLKIKDMKNKREELISNIGLEAWMFQQTHETTESTVIAAYVAGAYSNEAKEYWYNEFNQLTTK